MNDAEIVESLRMDRLAGFDVLYRSYAERLFAYAVTVLKDRAAAEDATHDALISAVDNIDRLRSVERLKPWLFAITRNHCLTSLKERQRFTQDEESLTMIPVPDEADAGLSRDESTALVQQALAALAPADRDTLALALRHDLDAGEVAAAMGSNQPTARARISRARSALTGSVTGLVLAREPQSDCAGLAAALHGFDGDWTELLRKRVAKHVKTCERCSEKGNRRAAAYVSGFVLPVALLLPMGGRARADELLASKGTAAAPMDWQGDGFPRPIDMVGSGARRGMAVAGVLAGAAVFLTGFLVWQGNAEEPPSAPPTQSGSPVASPSVSSSAPVVETSKDAAKTDKDAGQSPSPSATAHGNKNTPDPSPGRAGRKANGGSGGDATTDADKPGDKPTKEPEPTKNPDPTKDPEPTKVPEPTREPTPDPGPTDEPTKDPEPEPPQDPPVRDPDGPSVLSPDGGDSGPIVE